jgi:hypothetical protein
MAETTKPEDKKTVIAFIVGLLIGGLLVWAFSGPTASAPRETETADTKTDEKASDTKHEGDSVEAQDDSSSDEAAAAPQTLTVGEGSATVGDKKAGMTVPLAAVTYPVEEGWIGIRTYTEGRLGYILGVVRFSQSQGLSPSEIVLQTPTRAGAEYAVVMYTEDGDRQFNLAADTQIDKVFGSFTAE